MQKDMRYYIDLIENNGEEGVAEAEYNYNTTTTRLSQDTRSKLQQVYGVATAKGEKDLKSFQKGTGATADKIVNFLATLYLEKNVKLPNAGTLTPPMPIDDFIKDSKQG